jgi:hypothetical protein
MSAEANETIRISEAQIDALADQMRRAGRPFTLDELVEALQEIWRRQREGR